MVHMDIHVHVHVYVAAHPAHKHFIDEDSQCPPINGSIIWLVANDLRVRERKGRERERERERQVGERVTERLYFFPVIP